MRRKFFEAAWLFVILAAAVAFLTATTVGQELSGVTGVVDVCELNPEACAPVHREPLKCTDLSTLIGSHDWKPSAWVIWDDWWEVPEYYPPGKVTRVEVCSRCGFLRFPPESLKGIVENGR